MCALCQSTACTPTVASGDQLPGPCSCHEQLETAATDQDDSHEVHTSTSSSQSYRNGLTQDDTFQDACKGDAEDASVRAVLMRSHCIMRLDHQLLLAPVPCHHGRHLHACACASSHAEACMRMCKRICASMHEHIAPCNCPMWLELERGICKSRPHTLLCGPTSDCRLAPADIPAYLEVHDIQIQQWADDKVKSYPNAAA